VLQVNNSVTGAFTSNPVGAVALVVLGLVVAVAVLEAANRVNLTDRFLNWMGQ
jgi:hypothetical protein